MRMNSNLKVAILLLAVLAVLAVGLVVAVKSVNVDRVKELLTAEVQTTTGRTLTIAGPLEMRLGLIPRLVAGNVTLSNPPGSTRPDMVKIERVEMEVALLPLLKREILVNRLTLSAPDILIETEAKGAGHLGFSNANENSERKSFTGDGSSPYRFNLHDVTIEKGRVAWHDRGTGKTEAMEIHRLTVRPYLTSDELLAVRMAVTVQDRRVEIDGTVGQLDTAIGGEPWPVHLETEIEGMAITAQGAIAQLFALRGLNLQLTIQGGELSTVVQLAGMAKPDMPQTLGPFKVSARLSDAGGSLALADVEAEAGRRDTLLINAQGTVKDLRRVRGVELALAMESDNPAGLSWLAGTELPAKGPLHLSGLLRGSGKDWKLSGLKASLAGSDLTGHLAVQTAGRPHLSGTLSVNALVVSDFTGPAVPPGEKPASPPSRAKGGDGRVFPNQPLPVQGLRKLDADLTLEVGHLVLDDLQLTDTAVDLHLQDGRLLLKPFRAGLAGGKVEGEASLDAAGKEPAVTLLLTARQVELGKLSHHEIINGGKSDLQVDLKGRGNSVRALMATATGETVLSVGAGKIQNKAMNWAAGDLLFQVLGAFNPLAKQEDTTSLTCAAARFTVRDGIATAAKGIGVRTAKVDVVGSGTVDLRSESLDLGLRPRARQGAGLSLSTPLAGLTRLRGTFANPSIGIDQEGTLRAAASMGAAAATGGLSMLGELLLDKVTDSDPCRTALGQQPVQQKEKEKEKDRTQRPSGSDLIRGLFGR